MDIRYSHRTYPESAGVCIDFSLNYSLWEIERLYTKGSGNIPFQTAIPLHACVLNLLLHIYIRVYVCRDTNISLYPGWPGICGVY